MRHGSVSEYVTVHVAFVDGIIRLVGTCVALLRFGPLSVSVLLTVSVRTMFVGKGDTAYDGLIAVTKMWMKRKTGNTIFFSLV
jgi:hypothetical protein